LIGFAFVAGCSSLERLPAVPQAETKRATFLNFPNARYVIDEAIARAMIDEFRRAYEREIAYLRSTGRGGGLPPANYLEISGGGDNGAFGAGLPVGWSERGTRPAFKAVTGLPRRMPATSSQNDRFWRPSRMTACGIALIRPLHVLGASCCYFGPSSEMFGQNSISAIQRRSYSEFS
jgi:hypothetical protein